MKVFWYLPIIPRFRRIFCNPRDAKLARWHAESRKFDGKLRHPADSPEWRNIDNEFPEFGRESKNLRLGLCTDGMNPYGNWSTRHSTWPVLRKESGGQLDALVWHRRTQRPVGSHSQAMALLRVRCVSTSRPPYRTL